MQITLSLVVENFNHYQFSGLDRDLQMNNDHSLENYKVTQILTFNDMGERTEAYTNNNKGAGLVRNQAGPVAASRAK